MNSQKKSFWTIAIMVGINTLIRSFLEFFSNPEAGGMISAWYTTLEYFIFFSVMTLGLGILIGLFTREPYLRTTYRVAKFLPILFVAPLIDLIISNGNGLCMSYINSQGIRLIFDFLTFGGVFKTCGITIGMRIEILMIILGIGYGVWKKTLSLAKAVLSSFLSYLFIFINGAIPGIFGILATAGIKSFVLILAQIHLVTFILLASIAWARTTPREFSAWVHYCTSRWQLLLYYQILGSVGMYWSYTIYHTVPDIFTIIIASISLLLSCFAAGIINDISDREIDVIIHTNRPLENTISLESYQNLGIMFFILGTIAALLVSYPFFLFLLGFQALYAAYSLIGIRWKKHFITSSFTIGAISTSVLLAGYFLGNTNGSIFDISLLYLSIVFITVSIISNAKDFSDVHGDKPNNIRTLPVVYGKRRAGLIITSILSIWITIASLLVNDPLLIVLIIPWILIDFIIKKRIPYWGRFVILFVEILFIISRIK